MFNNNDSTESLERLQSYAMGYQNTIYKNMNYLKTVHSVESIEKKIIKSIAEIEENICY